MKPLANGLTDWLLKQGVIAEEDKELYGYAIFQLVFTLLPLSLFLTVCAILGRTVDGILMICPFILLRKYSGGIHLKSPISCSICSAMIVTASFCLAHHIVVSQQIILVSVLVVISGSSLFTHSPIDSDARRLTDSECNAFRKVARVMVLVSIAIYTVLTICDLWHRAAFWGMGLIIAAALQLPCLFRRKRA